MIKDKFSASHDGFCQCVNLARIDASEIFGPSWRRPCVIVPSWHDPSGWACSVRWIYLNPFLIPYSSCLISPPASEGCDLMPRSDFLVVTGPRGLRASAVRSTCWAQASFSCPALFYLFFPLWFPFSFALQVSKQYVLTRSNTPFALTMINMKELTFKSIASNKQDGYIFQA